MAWRGSGIGAGIGMSIGSTRSGSAQSVYGQMAPRASAAGLQVYLWVLVLVELGLIIFLRHAFRHYHGG